MKHQSLGPYANAMEHAGLRYSEDVQKGNMVFTPNVWVKDLVTAEERAKGAEWNCLIETSRTPVVVEVGMRNATRGLDVSMRMKQTFYTRDMLRLNISSEVEDWFTYECNDFRMQMETGDVCVVEVNITIDNTKHLVLKGEFTVPSELSCMGSHGILLLDPVNARWSVFVDVMQVIPKGTTEAQQWGVCVDLYARLSGYGPMC